MRTARPGSRCRWFLGVAGLGSLLVVTDVAHSGLEFLFRPIGVTEQIEVSIFLPVEFGELPPQGGPQFCRGFRGISAGVGGEGFERGAVLGGNGNACVVIGDSFFDLGYW